jgi:hypothetical protein
MTPILAILTILIIWILLAIVFKKLGFLEGVDEEIKEYNKKRNNFK